MQPLPDGSAVLRIVGSAAASHETSIQHMLEQAVDGVRTLTGGGGFGPDGASAEPGIADTTVGSVARLLADPELSRASADEPYSGTPGGFEDWSGTNVE